LRNHQFISKRLKDSMIWCFITKPWARRKTSVLANIVQKLPIPIAVYKSCCILYILFAKKFFLELKLEMSTQDLWGLIKYIPIFVGVPWHYPIPCVYCKCQRHIKVIGVTSPSNKLFMRFGLPKFSCILVLEVYFVGF